MALFQRKKKDSVLPEVDKYYQAERRDRGGLAWLLALVSIGVVALVIVLLFWGGRWIYRQITDDEPEVVTTGNNADDTPSIDGTPPSKDDGASSGDAGNDENADDPAAPEAGDEEITEEEEDQGTVDAPARTDTPSTPRTGDDTSDLPSTGAGSLIGIFTGVTTLAGGIHYVVQRRKVDR